MQQRYQAFRLAILAALGLPAACGSEVSEDPYNPPTKMNPPPQTPPASPCEGATLVLTSDGFYTGFAKCPDGTVHRLEPAPCDATIPGTPCQGDEENQYCKKNADCADGPYGRCVHSDADGNLGTSACRCEYACAQDSDCASGQACVCKDVVGPGATSKCSAASCSKGSDCASGECGLSVYFNGCSTHVELVCRADTDACRLTSECLMYQECAVDSFISPTWACNAVDCVSGRPLIVDGSARTAPAAPRGDWGSSGAALDVAGIEPALRKALSEHYQRVAAMEHASIASFARFTLELLALGAPPDLVADAQRAALDEVEHARMAYSIASVFEGSAIGAGPLDVRGVTIRVDRAAVIASLIEEACIGETLAAAEAAALAIDIADPALRRAHERIAEDELRHAALGWRTLAWLLQSADSTEEGLIDDLFARAAAAASGDPSSVGPVARSYGLASAHELGEIRRSALREIAEPCLRALRSRPILERPLGRI